MLVIGDTHGRTVWKDIVDLHPDEPVCFIGDYCDSYDVIPYFCWLNLLDIIEWARASRAGGREVILLLGNHDVHYLFKEDPTYRCSGYDNVMAWNYQQAFKDNLDLFQYAYYHEGSDALLTHAGITKDTYDWMNAYALREEFITEGTVPLHLIPALFWEMADEKTYRDYLFRAGYARGGHYPSGGIVWADVSELERDLALVPFRQVVGHTAISHITTRKFGDYNRITFCDVLGTSLPLVDKYLKI